MRKLIGGLATLGTVAITITAAPGAHAQAPFADVPRDHWAYDAVNTLAQRGLIIGYPDGTFGGKRAMTRYEFAVVIARMLPQLEESIRTTVQQEIGKQPGPTTIPDDVVRRSELQNYATKQDLDTVRKLVDQFAPELQMLQVDVASIRRDLDDVRKRVGIVEEEVGRVQVHGEMNVIARGSSVSRSDLDRNRIPMDLDGRKLFPTTNVLEGGQFLYDTDLGITAKVNDKITANTVLSVGNYIGGFMSGPRATMPYGNAGVGSLNAEITPWKAYISAPVTVGPLGVIDVEAGKTGVQFTPYTLKLIDYDSYTNVTKTDNGEVLFNGAKANFRVGGVGFTAYAGTHNKADNGSGFPVFMTANFTPRPYNPLSQPSLALFPGIPAALVELDQSAGVHATLGTPFGGNLGLSFIEGGMSGQSYFNGAAVLPVRRAQVYGADLALNLTKGIGLNLEYSKSKLQQAPDFKINNDTVYPRDLSSAYDARVAFGLAGVSLTAGYRQVDPFFGAPGYWGELGSWKNPTNIRGFVGTAAYAFNDRLSLTGSYDNYESVIRGAGLNPLETASDTKLYHYTAGLKFGLTSVNNVDLGIEQVVYTDIANAAARPASGDAKETYYNLGLGSKLAENTSLKLLYQIAKYDNYFLTNKANTKGNIAVAQFQVKF